MAFSEMLYEILKGVHPRQPKYKALIYHLLTDTTGNHVNLIWPVDPPPPHYSTIENVT